MYHRNLWPAVALCAAAFAGPALAQGSAAAQPNPTRAVVQRTLDDNFKGIDTNGDAMLSQAELAAAEAKSVQQRLAQVRGQFEAEFAKLDTNKDGALSKAEFLAAAPRASATAPDGAKSLAQLDRNKDGKVSAEEYRTPVLARFDGVDTNKDGTLSVAERQAAANKK